MRYMINSNMRCIEMCYTGGIKHRDLLINSNMRCIEIRMEQRNKSRLMMINSNMRCIEIKNGIKTDDVLSDKQ